MEIERYVLLPATDNSCAGIILSKITDTKIKVFPLQQMSFTPDPNEIQLYGENRGMPMAFQTEGLSVKNGLDMFMAVKWYARQQLDYPEMLIMQYPA
ncbi:hypothetical protein KHS38_05725 [Mucilaginibacter sp. Bleaf8]|uniref:hypothetical protein n=1 Tax=Mucilaginibacter sp. Bleaf8 TaxID=2834430 RepID=UPI001BCBE8AC|nr:hypothetical protein [Mucilaginibacter sp. Bleaf8]MBS7563897.1 hypothetical protein [Mucilaginibacter sp. Bleaf8]